MQRPKRTKTAEKDNISIPKLNPTDELVWDAIYEELIKHFNSKEESRSAKDALARLVAARCDERLILQNLFLFCGGEPKAWRALQEAIDFDRCRKRMLAIGELLEKASSEIQVAEQLLTDLDMTCYFTPDRHNLEKYGQLLQRVGNVVYPKLASRRISGRDQHLVFLCRMVELVTGRPHYRELAELVTATRRHFDSDWNGTETEDGIRKRVSGHVWTGARIELEMMGPQKASRPAQKRRK
jgi:hypothetical protein